MYNLKLAVLGYIASVAFSGFVTGGEDVQINCKVGHKGYTLINNNNITLSVICHKKKSVWGSIPHVPPVSTHGVVSLVLSTTFYQN